MFILFALLTFKYFLHLEDLNLSTEESRDIIKFIAQKKVLVLKNYCQL